VSSGDDSHHTHHSNDAQSATRQQWLAAEWSFLATALPRPPARVLEIGCGSAGGVIPAALAAGYEAIGVDPNAPDGPAYRQIPFADYEPASPFDAVVSVQALHHLPDLDDAFEQVDRMLAPDAVLVIVEWAWERLDQSTAEWLFARVPAGSDSGWAGERQSAWRASGMSWQDYRDHWARGHGLHTWHAVEAALTSHFDTVACEETPSLFGDVAEISERAERAAISAGEIVPTGVHWIGRKRDRERRQ
jgi:SAM-dependent methyltransferase